MRSRQFWNENNHNASASEQLLKPAECASKRDSAQSSGLMQDLLEVGRFKCADFNLLGLDLAPPKPCGYRRRRSREGGRGAESSGSSQPVTVECLWAAKPKVGQQRASTCALSREAATSLRRGREIGAENR